MNATNISKQIYELSKEILKEMWSQYPVRLIGIRLDKLTQNVNYQTSLFDNFDDKKSAEEVDKVVDNLKEKFGSKIIKKASMIETKINKKYD